jgi:hypothetical protein
MTSPFGPTEQPGSLAALLNLPGWRGTANGAPSAARPTANDAVPPPVDFGAPARASSPANGLRILSAAEMAEPLGPVDWLVRKIGIAPGAPTLIAGYGFVGKSLFAQSIAVAVASGTPLWGTFAVRKGRVLHVDYEQGRRITSDRYQRLAHAAGLSLADLPNLEAAILPNFYLDGEGALDRLCHVGEGRALVIVDSFRASCPGTDENSSDVRPVLDRMTAASEKTGCTFELIHHARKPRADDVGGGMMSIRGSSGFFDGSQCVLLLSAKKGQPITVEHAKERIEGTPCETFGLRVIDTDDRRGLSLEYLPPEQVADSVRTKTGERSDEQAAKDAAKVRERVLTYIGRNPGVAGAENVATSMGVQAGPIRAAVRQLVADGVVESLKGDGRGRSVRLYLQHAAPKEAT